MKLAVIGGGSTYTPELVSGLSRERDQVPVDELVLHDIDQERTVVGEMAARMLERQGFGGSLTVTDDLDAAVAARRSSSSSSESAARRPGFGTRRSRSRGCIGRGRPGPVDSRRRCAPCPSCSRSPSGSRPSRSLTHGSSTSRILSGS